jgi:hypothetical protein
MLTFFNSLLVASKNVREAVAGSAVAVATARRAVTERTRTIETATIFACIRQAASPVAALESSAGGHGGVNVWRWCRRRTFWVEKADVKSDACDEVALRLFIQNETNYSARIV